MKYFTLPILALSLNFLGALFITLSSGEYKGNRVKFFVGERNLTLRYPIMFRVGLISIVIGFFFNFYWRFQKLIKTYVYNG